MNRQAASFFVVGLLAGLLTATAGFALVVRSAQVAGGEGQAVTLRLGHGLDVQHPVHAGMEHMRDRLAHLSDGTMRIEIYPNEQLGTEAQTTEQVQQGALEMTKTSTAALEAFVPEMAVFGIPYLFDSYEHYWGVLEGELGQELLRIGMDRNVLGLCYYAAGSRSFYTRERPIRTPADLEGLSIRVQESAMAMNLVRSLGASPTPVPWGELYTALQQGVVDGAENNPPSLQSSRHYEVCQHYTLNEHTRVPDILLISVAAWQTLSPRQQEWLQQAADESMVFQRELWQEQTEQALAHLEEAGMEIHRPDPAPFAEAVEPMHAELAEDEMLSELMRRVREAGQ